MADMKQIDQMSEVTVKYTFAKQAQFFLNAMWPEHKDKAEEVYKTVQVFAEVNDHEEAFKAKNYEEVNGKSLGLFLGNLVMERCGTAVTALELRKILKDIDVNNDGQMSFLEYAVWKYNVNIPTMMNRPQGTNQDLEDAEIALEVVHKEIEKVEKKKKGLEKKIQKLESEQKEGKNVTVKMNVAKQALNILLAADNTEINKALISAEAKIRIAMKNANLAAPGANWWIERDLEEMKKYKPQKSHK